MNHLLKLTRCFGRMDEPLPKSQPFSASMGKWYETVPLQVTICTMPSPGVPFKVVFQNMASSAYFGPLEDTTPLPSAFSEAFLWEQFLGISDKERREELVAEMIQEVQTGEEWKQAIPMVTLVTPCPRGSANQPDLPAISVNQLRLHTILKESSADYSPHPSGTDSVLTRQETQTSGTSPAVCSFDRTVTGDRGQGHAKDHAQGKADHTMDNSTTRESPLLGSDGGQEPYSVLQCIRVTAKTLLDERSGQTWLVITHQDVTKAESFPKHVIDFMCGDAEDQGKTYGSLARSHEGVTILFMDIVGFTAMSKSVASADVHKVETAGDCYIISCGILERDENDGFVKSAAKVLGFAKDMLRISKLVNMPHNNESVTIRIGMHTGSVVSGVIGTKLPKFSVFGDTMNTASSALMYCPHALPPFLAPCTGGIEVKGKGIMETFHIEKDEEDLDAIKLLYKDELEKAASSQSLKLPETSPASRFLALAIGRGREATVNMDQLLFIGIPSDKTDFPAATRNVSHLPRSSNGTSAVVVQLP
eukprot:gene12556-15779_t